MITKSEQLRAAFDTFVASPLEETLGRHERTHPIEGALAVFRDAAANVPAYARLLAERDIDAASIFGMEDFARLPILTKKDYVATSTLAERCKGGRLDHCDMIAVSSGSTGEPTFWPRFVSDELAVAQRFEQVFVDSFGVKETPALAIVCFPMGTWVGGLYTTACLRHIAAKGLGVTIVAPGSNKEEILRVVAALETAAPQRVLLGYPPFLKDVIDTGRARRLDWSAVPTKLVLAGEVVSESWRTLVAERLGGASPTHDFASLYGTADAGVLGCETPLSIAIRRFLADRPDAARELFGESRLPTLVQYDPWSRYIEVVDDTIVITADGAAPIVRYGIADKGGVFGFDELLDRLADHGFDVRPRALEALCAGSALRRLPFVYVFGRADFTLSFYGANVFPENVTVGLEHPDVRGFVTGKFVMESRAGSDEDKRLHVTVELAPGVAADDEKRAAVAASIERELVRLNSEFANYVPAALRRPDVDLRPLGDAEYFPVGVKHRYTRRSPG